jgi:hypothetical protein
MQPKVACNYFVACKLYTRLEEVVKEKFLDAALPNFQGASCKNLIVADFSVEMWRPFPVR